MTNELSIESLIRSYCDLSGLHICICDQSGIWSHPTINIGHAYRVHSTPLCNTAKSTKKGFRWCWYCKTRAVKRAVEEQKPFHGHCPYGMLEVVHPIVMHSKTIAIIFIGHIVGDRQAFEAKAAKICRLTGVSFEKIMEQLPHTCPVEDVELYYRMADIIDWHIQHFLTLQPVPPPYSQRHWLTEKLLQCISEQYHTSLQLTDLAKTYFVNAKYAGRIFKRDMGRSFSEHLNKTRLAVAESKLIYSTASITQIAVDCGFGSASYFNRLFKNEYGMSPGEYRKKAKSKDLV